MAPVRRLLLRSRCLSYCAPSLHSMVLRSGRGCRQRRGRVYNRNPLVVPLNVIPVGELVAPLDQEVAPAVAILDPLVQASEISSDVTSAISSVDPLVVNVNFDPNLSANSPMIDSSAVTIDLDVVDVSSDFSSFDPSVFDIEPDVTDIDVADGEVAGIDVSSDFSTIEPSIVDVNFDIGDVDIADVEVADVNIYLLPDGSGAPEVEIMQDAAPVLPPVNPLPIPPMQDVLDFVALVGFEGPVFVVNEVLSFEEAVAVLYGLLYSEE